jgi:phosphatidylethanolamine/phosphatidyl-N-methylethanolamine N-methyltransferase
MLDQKRHSNPERSGKSLRSNIRLKSKRKANAKTQRPRSENSVVYSHLIPAYEMFFVVLVKKRIAQAVASLQLSAGDKVLEVGVGTGTSLNAYPHDVEVTGIDLSEKMLAVAKRRISDRGLSHIRVTPGNAERLDFPDATFDCVTSFHVVSVVSQPERMMQEIVRVVKPGGKVLIINHFRSSNPLIAGVIDRADPVTRHLGWRTDLECDAILRELPLKVEKRYKTSPWSFFTIVKATRTDAGPTSNPTDRSAETEA